MVDTGVGASPRPRCTPRLRRLAAPAPATPRSSPTATSTTSSASGLFEEEAAASGWPPPRVVAHEHLPRRFDRYVLTAGYNQVINRRQFGVDTLVWPTQYRYPDETYVDERARSDVGGLEVHLRHEKGETDDATVTWIPARRVLCPGDLFIWSSPNAGNPQKVQRYPREWAAGAAAHGRARRASSSCPATACRSSARSGSARRSPRPREYLESPGRPDARADERGRAAGRGPRTRSRRRRHLAGPAVPPARLRRAGVHRAQRLAPVRRVVGRQPRAPSSPRPSAALAAELAALAGGAGPAGRARRVPGRRGRRRRRCAWPATSPSSRGWRAPDDPAVVRGAPPRHRGARADAATSTMARGVFRWAARESSATRGPDGPDAGAIRLVSGRGKTHPAPSGCADRVPTVAPRAGARCAPAGRAGPLGLHRARLRRQARGDHDRALDLPPLAGLLDRRGRHRRAASSCSSSARSSATGASGDDIPRQSQYHLPLEMLYTVVPILIVFGLFAATSSWRTRSWPTPARRVTDRRQRLPVGLEVHLPRHRRRRRRPDDPGPDDGHPGGHRRPHHPARRPTSSTASTSEASTSRATRCPGCRTSSRFNAVQTGTFFGQCTQLCGLYHSLMFFQVKVVTPSQYSAWLAQTHQPPPPLAAAAHGDRSSRPPRRSRRSRPRARGTN